MCNCFAELNKFMVYAELNRFMAYVNESSMEKGILYFSHHKNINTYLYLKIFDIKSSHWVGKKLL